MERASAEVLRFEKSATPRTTQATFTITEADVGTPAVRPGISHDLELERAALLIAGKAVLKRIREGNIHLGAAQETALEVAIRMAEVGK